MTNWNLLSACLESPTVRTMYVWGRPGIGKTYAAYHYGKLDKGVYAVTLTEDTPSAELRGHYVPTDEGGLRWQDGPLIEAMRKGSRLVLNEVSHAGPEALSFLHPVLESPETARLTLPTNETVSPAEGFHVIATDNFPLEDLPFALRDRFNIQFHITTYHPDALNRLTPNLRKAALNTVNLEEDRAISLRGWITIQELQEDGMPLQDACVCAFGEDKGIMVRDAVMMAIRGGE